MAKKKSAAATSADKSKNPFVLAAVVSDRVQIQDVRVVECRVSQAPPHDGGPRAFKALNKVEVNFSIDADRNLILILPRFSFRERAEADDAELPTLAIDCLFALTYAAPAVADLPKLNVKAFAQTNGIFNAWPYWREFAQNMAARMGLPSLVIPVFRFSDPPSRGRPKTE